MPLDSSQKQQLQMYLEQEWFPAVNAVQRDVELQLVLQQMEADLQLQMDEANYTQEKQAEVWDFVYSFPVIASARARVREYERQTAIGPTPPTTPPPTRPMPAPRAPGKKRWLLMAGAALVAGGLAYAIAVTLDKPSAATY